jgi:uncharacterized membrane protein
MAAWALMGMAATVAGLALACCFVCVWGGRSNENERCWPFSVEWCSRVMLVAT